jgi:hypothetical protein
MRYAAHVYMYVYLPYLTETLLRQLLPKCDAKTAITSSVLYMTDGPCCAAITMALAGNSAKQC